MVISIVGNYNFEKLISLVEKYFSEQKHKTASKNDKKFKPNKKQKVVITKNTHQTHCIIGNTAYSSLDKKRVQLILLNNIIGGPGMNSLLNMSLREKYGFVYNVESNYTFYKDTGIWNIYLGTDKENLDKSLELITKILKQKQTDLISVSKLEKSKKQLLGQIAIGSENYSEHVFSMAKSILLFNKISTLNEIAKSINEITNHCLRDISNEIFDKDKLSSLVYK
jgi:predicted Zn-dependent peptidase